MVDRHVAELTDLATSVQAGEFARADLVFYGVDHSLDSYEGRVYLNDAEAGAQTGRDKPTYVGSFHIFGHGGCFGDLGHCDIPSGPRDPFDLRPPHQLTPVAKVVIVTEGLRRCLAEAQDKSRLTVTVVAVVPGEAGNEVLRFQEVRLLAYR